MNHVGNVFTYVYVAHCDLSSCRMVQVESIIKNVAGLAVRGRWRKASVFQKKVEFGIHWTKAIDAFMNALADDVCLAKRELSLKGIFVVIEFAGYCYQVAVCEEIFVPQTDVKLDTRVV